MKPEEMKVLICGGGIAGMTTTLALRAKGVQVDLLDLDPRWRVYGAGITVTRPTMRAFDQLGLLDDLLVAGYAGNGIRICTPDGTEVDWVVDPEIPGTPLPGSGGVMRPDLHRMLSTRVKASGARVNLGVTIESIDHNGDHVDVTLSDGSKGRYDLVLGADGLGSRVRTLIRPDAPKPEYTGQMIWRLFAPKPPEIDRRHFFLGGKMKIGLSPVSETHLYMFLLEACPQRAITPDEELPGELSKLMEGYGGIVAQLREALNPQSQIVLRPLEAFILPPPWHKGCVLLVGDAAHPTTPQLASGAGMAVEDAIVVTEELERHGWDVPASLAAYEARRWDRCRTVVENSIEIGRREQAGAPPAEQTILLEQSLAKLAEPI